nr:hypothetical protein [Streptomyces sp. 846.5]
MAIYNTLVSVPHILTPVFRSGWLFDTAPSELGSLASWTVLAAVVGIWLTRVALTLIVTQQMYRISVGHPVRMARPLTGLKPAIFVWYALVSAGLFMVTLIIFTVLWVAGWMAWKAFKVDVTLAILLLCGVGYPLYISWLASTALISVLPIERRARWVGTIHALGWQFTRSLYFYYLARIGLEYLLAGAVLYISVIVSSDSIWVHVLGSIALVIPLLFLRTVTYARTVDVMSLREELSQALISESS